MKPGAFVSLLYKYVPDWGANRDSFNHLLGTTMKKFVVTFLLGFAVASGLFLLVVLPRYGREKVEFGRQQGEILTKLQLMRYPLPWGKIITGRTDTGLSSRSRLMPSLWSSGTE